MIGLVNVRRKGAKAAAPLPGAVTTLKQNVNKAIDEWAFFREHSWAILAPVAGKMTHGSKRIG